MVVERADESPSLVDAALEQDGLAVVARGDKGVLRDEDERDGGKGGQLDGVDGVRGSLGSRGVDDGDGRVVACAIEESSQLSPFLSSSAESSLAKARASPLGEKATPWTHPPEGLVNSPQTVLKGRRSPQTVGVGLLKREDQRTRSASSSHPNSLGIDALHESGKDPSHAICRSSSKKDRVGVPIEGEHRRAEGLLDVLSDPPIALLIKLADSDGPGSGSYRKLLLVGRPADERRRAVQAEENEGREPGGRARLGVGEVVPDVGVAVVRASDDPVRLRRPVDARHQLVML